jgi:hypothetical protein
VILVWSKKSPRLKSNRDYVYCGECVR